MREAQHAIDALAVDKKQLGEQLAATELELDQLRTSYANELSERQKLQTQVQQAHFAAPRAQAAVESTPAPAVQGESKKFAVRAPLANFNQASILPGARAVAQPAPLTLACETPTTKLDQKWKSSTPMHHGTEDQTESQQECNAQ